MMNAKQDGEFNRNAHIPDDMKSDIIAIVSRNSPAPQYWTIQNSIDLTLRRHQIVGIEKRYLLVRVRVSYASLTP